MSGASHPRSPYDLAPDAALDAVASHPGTLLLDLDETAYLRNSTEDFIDSARPGVLALLMLRVLDAVRPWRWTGGEETRDLWRVRLVTILMPWIWIGWRRRVAQLAADHSNRPLLDAVARRSAPTIVVTLGFQRVVQPLVMAMGLGQHALIASRLNRFDDRRKGKLGMAEAALDADTIARSAVITDSRQDLPLLARCALPIRTLWPDARYRPALIGTYLPGQYLSRVKRPGQRYIFRGILQEDFALWVICSFALLPSLPGGLVGLGFLLISFWAIYERGYVDNDRVAERYEKTPKLSDAYGVVEVATPRWQPWIWAAVCGLIAILLLRWPGVATLEDFAGWAAVLIGTHALFWIYNRLDKGSRIWLFAGLQLLRSVAFVVLVPIGLVAALALGAHVIARWVPYFLYRVGGKDWPKAPVFLARLLFYILLWLIFAITQPISLILTWTALALLLWSGFRARKELLTMLRGVHRIDRDRTPGMLP